MRKPRIHGYIAADPNAPIVRVIYGIGWTEWKAVQDARDETRNPEAYFPTLYPATLRLMAAVLEYGGGPDDVRWELIGEGDEPYADLAEEVIVGASGKGG